MAPSEKMLRVLNIEDSQSDSDSIKKILTELSSAVLFKRAGTREHLEEALESQSWDLVIADYGTSSVSAQEALHLVRSRVPDLPFVLMCGSIGEESVADMMKAGVEDLVKKSGPERLLPVVKRVLRERETREKEVQASRPASEAHAAKEQMLAIVSHDIKNPLSAIQLEAQMLLRVVERHGKSLLGEEVKIQAGRILKTTDRLKGLISDLLDKNKSENGLSVLSPVKVPITKLYQEVLDALRPHLRQKDILIRSSFPAAPAMLEVDKNKMFQVLTNLVSNAIKFTPKGGTIVFSLDEGEHDCTFSISDNGPGLPAEHLPRVFDKYWTGKISGQSGTGLGLFICKTIVEAHGGQIMAENLSEGGARFYFTLPKHPSHPIVRKEQLIGEGRKGVMLIDDDEDLREVIAWALSKEGYAVASYKDPREALLAMGTGKILPQLILADYHMEGMKGAEFLNLKNDLPHAQGCPVLMISASPAEVEREVQRALYKEIITKPLDLEGLVENMKKYFA